MTAKEVLEVLTRNTKDAVVPEIVLNDPYVKAQQDAYDHDRRTVAYRDKEGPCRPGPGPQDSWFRRIDALIVNGSQRTAIEIKVSHVDFLRETDAKRRPWLPIVHRFVYVCPAEVIQPSEVPDGCGLWWVVEDPRGRGHGYRKLEIKKRATINKNPDPIPPQIVVALCYRVAKLPVPESMAPSAGVKVLEPEESRSLWD